MMKSNRRKSFLVVVFSLLMIFVFAFSGCEKKLTDEEMIVERIENFEKTYNDGDFEGFLENLTTKERKQIQATFNIFGAIFGGLSGVSIDLADLFSLGIGLQEGDWLQVEILEVEIVSDSVAYVSTVWTFTQGALGVTNTQTSAMYFYMLKEKGDWYVKDMTESRPTP